MDFKVCFPTVAEEIEALKTKFEESLKGNEDQSSKIEELTAKLAESEEERKKIEAELVAVKETNLNELDRRIRALEDFDVGTVKTSATAAETQLPIVLEEIEKFRNEISKQNTLVSDAESNANIANGKCSEFQVQVKKLEYEWNVFVKDSKKLEDVIKNFDAGIKRVEDQQDTLQDTVSKKYQQMWSEVPRALEEMSTKHVESLQRDLQKKAQTNVTEVQSLVSYALQILAKVQAEKKRETDKNNLLLHWRNQTWIQARRRLGCETLKRFLKSRINDAFSKWKSQAMYETTVKRITAQFMERIPDVPKALDEIGVPSKLDNLQDQILRMGDDKAGKDDVMDEINKSNQIFTARLDSLDQLRDALDRLRSELLSLQDTVSSTSGFHDDLTARAEEASLQIENVKKTIVDNYAQNTEVQAMVKDVLLIWYSIKQLDATKADKKDMEAYALEQINRERSAVRNDIMERTEEMNKEIGTVVGSMEDLSSRNRDQATQFLNMQNMMGNLASFLEELVLKIAEMQGVEVASHDGPTFGSGSADSMNNVEDMNRWIHYAKGVVDQSLDAYHNTNRKKQHATSTPTPAAKQGGTGRGARPGARR